MSRQDKQYHLRHLHCEGCWRKCRYRDFRGQVPADPNRGEVWSSFREVAHELHLRAKESNHGQRDEVVRVTRGKILGAIHEQKIKMWDYLTEDCPHKGEDPFQDAETAIEYLLKVPAWKALMIVRGMPERKARALRTTPTLKDFQDWWAKRVPF